MTFTDVLGTINDAVWGPFMLFLLVGTGVILTVGLKCMPWRRIVYAFRLMWRGRRSEHGSHGELTPFNSLMTALAATVGTGNIAGVATAIFMGGPGALFWMWCTAMVGMATKFAESVLAVKYRERTPDGHFVGGAMYFIKNGLGPKWVWMGTLFAIFGALAGFGIGNMVQSNSIIGAILPVLPDSWIVGSAMEKTDVINLSPVRLAVALMLLLGIGAVLVGGLKRIGDVAGKIVPFMCIFYILCALGVIFMHIAEVPRIFAMVIGEAFSPTAAAGGITGHTVAQAMRYGLARGVFSNEAGMGSAPIAHAAASVNSPVRMGIISMLGTFIDTIIVCTMTGFAILATGLWNNSEDLTGSALTSAAFESVFPGLGSVMVAIGSVLFAFTTILGWCVYSERCVIYLFGDRGLKPFRVIFTLAVPFGVICQLNTVWLVADTLNALMAIPNLIGVLMLSPVVFRLTKAYFLKDDGTGLHVEDDDFV